jgi:hypothetical protein
MKEWKANQVLYHRLTQVHTDAVENFPTRLDDNAVGAALDYFYNPQDESVYPGKSYAVALIYARLLRDHFGENFYEVLSDPELLYNNDEYFVPYHRDPQTYDAILTAVGGVDAIPLSGRWVDYTVRYFRDECLAEAPCFKM